MKYCCEKCFSGLDDFRDYVIKNHEKTGTCDYCGEENVKLISVSKMRKPFFEIIDKEHYTVDKSETDCEGEDYYTFGGYQVDSLADLFDWLEDIYLADHDFQLNDRLFFDACDDDDDSVFYLSKHGLPDDIKKIFE